MGQSIPDMTQRFPEGMYEIYEEPKRTNLKFGDVINNYIEYTKSEFEYYYLWVYVIIDGKRYEYRSLEEVKSKHADKLNEYLYHTHWFDEEIVFEL